MGEVSENKKTWIKGGKVGLSKALPQSVDRKTIDRWSKLPGFPKPRANGDYCLEDALAFITSKDLKGGETSSLYQLKERELKARCAKLEFELEVQKGKYVLLAEAERETTQLNSDTKNILRAKFENELPPTLEGLSAAAIQERCKAALDEVCERLSR